MSPRGRFTALLVADIASALGSRVSLVAIPWLVLVTTGSASDTGLIAAAEMVPYLLSSTLLTPLADRLGLRVSSVLCDLVSAVAMAGIAAFPHAGFGWLSLLVAVAGGLRGVGDRAKHVLLRPAALLAGYPLLRVTALYEGLTRLVTLLGSPLAGLLIVVSGAQGAIWVDAASFGWCALLVAGLVADVPAEDGREPYRTALAGGFRYLRGDRVLSGMLGTVFMLNLFANAATLVFIPVWARDVLHSPEALGLALGAFAGGALLGTLVFTIVAERLPRYPTFLLGALISGAPRLFAIGLSGTLAVVLVVSVLAGFGIAAVNPILGVAMYERVPDALQTRVIGLCTTVSFTGIPIGALAGGWAVTEFGLRQSLLVAGGLCLAVNLIPLLGARRVSLAPAAPA
ncbi:MAG TPA: MFS transporter [Jatrophihabitans sp.]|jgi:sugar phosphate permease|nr:MFS transporter [Jatrophihabitans sp.]